MTTVNEIIRPGGGALAYHRHQGDTPGVVFFGGFMSDMEGSKALAVEAYAIKRGRAVLRFDYAGHGSSEGRFEEGTIGSWYADALYMIDTLTDGPLVLVGSSMGGWIASLIARARPERVAGLIGIAAAPDFTERMWSRDLTDQQRKAILEAGSVSISSDYGPDPYIFTKALFDDGRAMSVLSDSLRIDAPVRLIQGTDDPDVPWETAVSFAKHLEDSGSDDVEVLLVPGGDHRLSREQDLKRLVRVLDELWGTAWS